MVEPLNSFSFGYRVIKSVGPKCQMVGWLIDQSVILAVGRVVNWPVGWLLVDWSVGLLVCWLVGWLIGW
jgi:hypothetical protein